MTTLKPKKCRNPECGEYFTPARPLQVVCCYRCGLAVAARVHEKKLAAQAKIERAKDREKQDALRPRRDWIKLCQVAFNSMIRERDRLRPCICCGRNLSDPRFGGGYDCGHYRSTGSAPHLRFDQRNAHAQLKHCNRYMSGRAVDYRIGLIHRYGLEMVEQLESDQAPRKYEIDDLREMIRFFRACEKVYRLDNDERLMRELAA